MRSQRAHHSARQHTPQITPVIGVLLSHIDNCPPQRLPGLPSDLEFSLFVSSALVYEGGRGIRLDKRHRALGEWRRGSS